MEATIKKAITVENRVNAPISKVWELWTNPEHITQWNNASDDWHTPHAENDVRPGGRFLFRMAAKDGSFSFDFTGGYDEIKPNQLIAYTTDDGRKVKINFTSEADQTRVVETFEAEDTNPMEMQRQGWQNIMDSFKKYAESK